MTTASKKITPSRSGLTRNPGHRKESASGPDRAQARSPPMKTSKLTCTSCTETFNLEQDGGTIEYLQPGSGTCHCKKCAKQIKEFETRFDAAKLLLEGTGFTVQEL
jgi:hypothetical protein